jgi:hypothetical protein
MRITQRMGKGTKESTIARKIKPRRDFVLIFICGNHLYSVEAFRRAVRAANRLVQIRIVVQNGFITSNIG